MKKLQSILPIFLLALATLFFACGGEKSSDASQSTKTEMTEQGPEYTSAYICPMHCKGSGSDKKGTCPVCEMDYISNKNAKHDHHGHDHDGHDHHGHDHDGHDHDGHDHGSHEGHSH